MNQITDIGEIVGANQQIVVAGVVSERGSVGVLSRGRVLRATLTLFDINGISCRTLLSPLRI